MIRSAYEFSSSAGLCDTNVTLSWALCSSDSVKYRSSSTCTSWGLMKSRLRVTERVPWAANDS